MNTNENLYPMQPNIRLITTFASLIFSVAVVLSACKKEDEEDDDDSVTQTTDEFLLEMAIETSGFTWYKNSDALLPKSNGSGHQETHLRTRYNTTAATMLDSDGKVMSGITFPEGSLIVKELRNDLSEVLTYAILYKQAGHADADADGWVWGYVRPSGEVRLAASEKGNGCRGCHSQSGSIDFTLMNKFFP